MRRVLPYLAGLLVVAACSDTLPVEQPSASTPRFGVVGETSGRYVVLLSPSINADQFARAVGSLGGTVVAQHAGAGFAVVEGLSSTRAASLARQRGIQAVERDLVARMVEPAARSVAEAAADAADVGGESQTNPATAVFFPIQWNHRAIGAHTAWAAGQLGSPSVTVAILDSGIDHLYLDFRPSATSPASLVDVARSASFVPTGSTDPLDPSDDQLLETFFPGSGRPAWSDLNGHGTFTAGIVSSKAIAAAGVTSKVTLMAVKVMNARGVGAFSAILQGVLHAADNGADVINMSLGAEFARHGGYIGFLNNITRYARSRGVTIVVAAGNSAIDLDHSGGVYSAFCSSGMVICVSATGPNRATTAAGPYFPSVDESAIYTNFGTSSVDVAAPGGNYTLNEDEELATFVAIWSACSRTKLNYVEPEPEEEGEEPPPPFYEKNICTTGTFVSGAFGTSASAPHVAGLAALLVGRVGRSPGMIRDIIQATADDLGKPGADPRYGKGRINVARALGLTP